MSALSFNPTVEPITYTIEQVNTVVPHDWQNFVLAVTDTFWRLPPILRPYDGQHRALTDVSGLFPDSGVLAFSGETDAEHRPDVITVERIRSNNTLCVQEFTSQHQPYDFFSRLVMVLLHSLCPNNFRVHSSAGEASWSMPLRWLNRNLGWPVLSAPLSPSSVTVMAGVVDELLLTFLSDPKRSLNKDDWRILTETEHRLYQLKAENFYEY